MEVERRYTDYRFSPRIVAEAAGVFDSVTAASNRSSYFCSVSTRADETITVTSLDEFLLLTQGEFEKANFTRRKDDHTLVVRLYRDGALVSVAAASRADIERVFNVFEVAKEGARIERVQEIVPRYDWANLKAMAPSCDVSISLIRQLQRLLAERGPRVVGIDEGKGEIDISIKEEGWQHFYTIESYDLDQFRDSVEFVKLTFEARDAGRVSKYEISFAPTGGLVEASAQCPGAKEATAALVSECLAAIREKKNLNHYWQRVSSVSEILALMAFMLAFACGALKLWTPSISAVMASALIFIGGRIIARHKPYCAFDTSSQRIREDRFKWFVRAAIVFILFGICLATVAQSLRRQILGW